MVCKLLKALECIKKAFRTDKEHKVTRASAKGRGSSKKSHFSNRIPKKCHMDEKHCILCKQHGGIHNTHNITECCKYEKDGTLKKSFAEKGAQYNLHCSNVPHEQNKSYM